MRKFEYFLYLNNSVLKCVDFGELLTSIKFPQEIKFIVSIKILILYSFNFLFFINFNFVNGRIKKFLCSFVKIFQIYFLFLIKNPYETNKYNICKAIWAFFTKKATTEHYGTYLIIHNTCPKT